MDNKLTGAITGLSLAMSMYATTAIAGPDALLGVQLTEPMVGVTTISFYGDTGANYDGSSLNVNATAVSLTFTNGGASEAVAAGDFVLSATIDSSGVFSGGTFSIYGAVTDTATGISYDGTVTPLLTGVVADYGMNNLTLNASGLDYADFKLTVTGGMLQPLFDAATSTGAAAVLALEGSDYNGSFGNTWSAGTVKGDVGAVPDIPPADTQTIGYWKNHDWPVSNLVICGQSYLRDALIDVLKTPTRKLKTLIMAKQLIAAKLNEVTFNACPAIVEAEAWLCGHGGISGDRLEWDGGETLKNTLDTFNNGGGC